MKTNRVYLDTSAVVPLYVSEIWSEPANRHVRSLGKKVISSLVVSEFSAALSGKVKRGLLSKGDGLAARRLFEKHLRDGFFEFVSVEPFHFKRAAALVWETDVLLRTLDALHVAISEAIDAEILSADDRLILAAREIGLRVSDLREAE